MVGNPWGGREGVQMQGGGAAGVVCVAFACGRVAGRQSRQRATTALPVSASVARSKQQARLYVAPGARPPPRHLHAILPAQRPVGLLVAVDGRKGHDALQGGWQGGRSLARTTTGQAGRAAAVKAGQRCRTSSLAAALEKAGARALQWPHQGAKNSCRASGAGGGGQRRLQLQAGSSAPRSSGIYGPCDRFV